MTETKKKIDKFDGEYSWLSNFYPCELRIGSITYPSIEHAYQAMKTNDRSEQEKFKIGTAGQAKRAGRKVSLRSDWEDVKVSMMANLLYRKFKQYWFKEKLLATGDAYLEEGNHWGDTYWGVCNGKGKNMLGHLLMDVRRALEDEQSND